VSTKKIIIVFDLGPGDGGKGGMVHKLAHYHKAHTIIKVGGAQGSHGVSTKRQNFAFSQWGCGTFEGVRTHITPLMVVSPEGLLNEADALRYHGVINPFDLLTVDRRAICATPYHGIASRLKELARGRNPRGTIGTGVGDAFRSSVSDPELTIRVDDLSSDSGAAFRFVSRKLRSVRINQIKALGKLQRESVFLRSDKDAVEAEFDLLHDDGFLDHCVDRFLEVGRVLKIVDPDFMKREIFTTDGVAIVESSHGVLTDSHFGFHPHVSAIRTLPSFSHDMLVDAGFTGEVVKIGVHRAYSVRHGAGPMPTADPDMNDNLLPGSSKGENRYQGKIRVGPLDFVLLRYAIDVCGGPGAIDGLAISWFDQISRNGVWKTCNRYDDYDNNYFASDERIRVYGGESYQQKLCSSLFACKPEIVSIELPNSVGEQCRLCDRELHDKLGVPVHLISFGPAEQNKIMRNET
jgi:adenylosuccinate synthase